MNDPRKPRGLRIHTSVSFYYNLISQPFFIFAYNQPTRMRNSGRPDFAQKKIIIMMNDLSRPRSTMETKNNLPALCFIRQNKKDHNKKNRRTKHSASRWPSSLILDVVYNVLFCSRSYRINSFFLFPYKTISKKFKTELLNSGSNVLTIVNRFFQKLPIRGIDFRPFIILPSLYTLISYST